MWSSGGPQLLPEGCVQNRVGKCGSTGVRITAVIQLRNSDDLVQASPSRDVGSSDAAMGFSVGV